MFLVLFVWLKVEAKSWSLAQTGNECVWHHADLSFSVIQKLYSVPRFPWCCVKCYFSSHRLFNKSNKWEYGSVFSDQKWSWKPRVFPDFWNSLHHSINDHQEGIKEGVVFSVPIVSIKLDVDGWNDSIENKSEVKTHLRLNTAWFTHR